MMAKRARRVLVVEDNPGDLRLISEMLGGGEFEVTSCGTLAAAIDRLAGAEFDVALVDLGLPDSDGLETFARVREAAPGVAIVVLSGNSDVELAVQAVEAGAQDFLVKGQVDEHLLARAISYACSRQQSDDAMEQEKALLARAEEIARLGSWRYEVITRDMWWSDEMYRIFGVGAGTRPQDLLATARESIHPEDSEPAWTMLRAVVVDATESSTQFRILLPDGRLRWIDVQSRPELNGRSVVVAVTGFAQDITEVKVAEERRERVAGLDRAVAMLSTLMVAADPPMDELAELVLDDAKNLTGSLVGFLNSSDPGMAEATYTNSPAAHAVPSDVAEAHGPMTCVLSVPSVAEGRCVGQITVANAPDGYGDEDLEIVKRLASLYAIALVGQEKRAALLESEASLRLSNLRFERMVYGVAEAMGRIVEVRDPYTQGHEVRVARLGKLIAEEMHLSEDEIEAIEMSGLVHDIGKLCVPAEILTKPGKLIDEEFALIKKHSEAGYSILKGIEFPWSIAEIVLAHHERMDGSGYPSGLAGDDIPLASRVLAVADVAEAMASHRPYRAALGLDAAVAELTENPHMYDRSVVNAFMALHSSGRVDFLPPI
jgi:response regulator RpfG family c-di-GMP phosphodiesterase